jgi:hypothetical protein
MSFSGNEDHSIDVSTAGEWTKNYRDGKTLGDPDGFFFGKATIINILAQPGCVGIRIYQAIDSENEKHLVICGVNGQEADLYNGIVAERGIPGPPFGASSPLNS